MCVIICFASLFLSVCVLFYIRQLFGAPFFKKKNTTTTKTNSFHSFQARTKKKHSPALFLTSIICWPDRISLLFTFMCLLVLTVKVHTRALAFACVGVGCRVAWKRHATFMQYGWWLHFLFLTFSFSTAFNFTLFFKCVNLEEKIVYCVWITNAREFLFCIFFFFLVFSKCIWTIPAVLLSCLFVCFFFCCWEIWIGFCILCVMLFFLHSLNN